MPPEKSRQKHVAPSSNSPPSPRLSAWLCMHKQCCCSRHHAACPEAGTVTATISPTKLTHVTTGWSHLGFQSFISVKNFGIFFFLAISSKPRESWFRRESRLAYTERHFLKKCVPTISKLNTMIVKSFRVLTVNSVLSSGKAQNKTGIYVSGCIKLLLHQKTLEIFSFSSAWTFFSNCIHPIAKIWQEGRSNLPKSDNHFSPDPNKIASWNLWTHRRDPQTRCVAASSPMWGPPAAGQQRPTWWLAANLRVFPPPDGFTRAWFFPSKFWIDGNHEFG